MYNKINKKYQNFFLFHFRIFYLKKDNMTQDIATVKIKKKRESEKKKKEEKEKVKKEID